LVNYRKLGLGIAELCKPKLMDEKSEDQPQWFALCSCLFGMGVVS